MTSTSKSRGGCDSFWRKLHYVNWKYNEICFFFNIFLQSWWEYMLVSTTYQFISITLNSNFCQWRSSNWTIIFKYIVQTDIFLSMHAHNNQQKTKQNINGYKERDCIMNYMYCCTDSYKSSLDLSFLFPFSFFPFHFLAIAGFFSFSFFSFSLFPLPFHFPECTSGLRRINGNNLREGYNYLKNVSHFLLCTVWKKHVFSICTADQLRQNCLVEDSTESIRSHLLQPKNDY